MKRHLKCIDIKGLKMKRNVDMLNLTCFNMYLT